jgi:transcriptional regulator with XRE-family HTH domain
MRGDVARCLDKWRARRKTAAMHTTGLDLRLERTAARVKLIDLAKRMERSRSTVARYEGLAVVDPDIAALYRVTLATFRVVAA